MARDLFGKKDTDDVMPHDDSSYDDDSVILCTSSSSTRLYLVLVGSSRLL